MTASLTFALYCLVGLTVGSETEIISSPIGTGTPGYGGDGGPAVEARLHEPFDLAFDPQGRLVFSDTSNHCLRRFDPGTGRIETIAGTGQAGFSGDGGPARDARLNEPYGLAIDDQGNVYVADRLNRRVRCVESGSGRIRTVAGNGSEAFSGDGGPGPEAGIVEPNGVALDGRGRLFIADVAGHRVRVLDLDSGRIATFAGNGSARRDGDGGPATDAALFGPRAVHIGRDGTLWILERNGHSLRAVDPRTGRIHTVAGNGRKGYSGDGGPAREATFDGPKELDIDQEGNVFIVDTENQVIRRIDDKTGIITTVAGNGTRGGAGDGGPATEAQLDRPHGVAVDPRDGSLWIGDTNNHRIRRVHRRP